MIFFILADKLILFRLGFLNSYCTPKFPPLLSMWKMISRKLIAEEGRGRKKKKMVWSLVFWEEPVRDKHKNLHLMSPVSVQDLLVSTCNSVNQRMLPKCVSLILYCWEILTFFYLLVPALSCLFCIPSSHGLAKQSFISLTANPICFISIDTACG